MHVYCFEIDKARATKEQRREFERKMHLSDAATSLRLDAFFVLKHLGYDVQELRSWQTSLRIYTEISPEHYEILERELGVPLKILKIYPI